MSELGYLCVVIDRPANLRSRYEVTVNHHCTLAFNVSRSNYENILGHRTEICLLGDYWSDEYGIQAAGVSLPYSLTQLFSLVIPHVTISRREDVPPVRSTDMLSDPYKKMDHFYEFIGGTITFVPFTRP